MEDSVNKMVAQIILDERIIINKTIYSKILNTNDDGKLEGEIDISKWPLSEYNIMFYYGYDRESRTAWNNFFDDVLDVALIVAGVGALFIPGIGWGLSAAIFTAEIAASVALEMMRAYGEVTENKYGVQFPKYGFMHPYGFGMYGEEVAQENEGVFSGLTNGTSDEDMIKIGGGIFTCGITTEADTMNTWDVAKWMSEGKKVFNAVTTFQKMQSSSGTRSETKSPYFDCNTQHRVQGWRTRSGSGNDSHALTDSIIIDYRLIWGHGGWVVIQHRQFSQTRN